MKKLNKLISNLNKFRTSPIKMFKIFKKFFLSIKSIYFNEYKIIYFIIFLFLGSIVLYEYQIEILKYIVDVRKAHKFSSNNINNIIDGFKDYLATLNFYQLCILFNIFGSIFIILCLITIVLIYAGDYFINYLDLENRFP